MERKPILTTCWAERPGGKARKARRANKQYPSGDNLHFDWGREKLCHDRADSASDKDVTLAQLRKSEAV
jgi:hypothetical protein